MLLGSCAVVLLLLELGSVYLVKHDSETYLRVERQCAEAITARPAAVGNPPSVLMVGNSLLLYGVDVERLHELTSARMRTYPVFMEGTGYYDWLYGLRRLFRRGARPQVVVMGFEVYSALGQGVWSETPMVLFDARDVLGAASDLGLDRTATSDLMLSHISAFWAMRDLFRRRIFQLFIPRYEELFPFVRQSDLTAPTGVKFEATVTQRVRILRELCEANGAKLILLIPPSPASEGTNQEIVMGSRNAGVRALLPLDSQTLSAKFYQTDHIHLNAQGAVRFTSALAADLPKMIAEELDRHS